MDSLDLVEMVVFLEEIPGNAIPDNDAETFESRREISPREVVDWLEQRISKQRANKQAAARLRKLTKVNGSPELAEGVDGTWRRQQIAAVVRERFR